MFRILTFVMNSVMLHHITRDLLGVANVRYCAMLHAYLIAVLAMYFLWLQWQSICIVIAVIEVDCQFVESW